MSGHHHHAPESDRGLLGAIFINILLTLAQVVVTSNELQKVEVIKRKLKEILKNKFKITHSTLEFEYFIDSNSEEHD